MSLGVFALGFVHRPDVVVGLRGFGSTTRAKDIHLVLIARRDDRVGKLADELQGRYAIKTRIVPNTVDLGDISRARLCETASVRGVIDARGSLGFSLWLNRSSDSHQPSPAPPNEP